MCHNQPILINDNLGSEPVANPKLEGTPAVMLESCESLPVTEHERVACGLHIASRRVASELTQAAAKHGLSGMEANFILKMNLGADSPTIIATCLGVEPSNLSRLMRRLEKDGLVKRHTDESNRSRVRVTLTARGKTKAKALKPDMLKAEQNVLSGLNDKELKQLRNVLQKLCLSFLPVNTPQ